MRLQHHRCELVGSTEGVSDKEDGDEVEKEEAQEEKEEEEEEVGGGGWNRKARLHTPISPAQARLHVMSEPTGYSHHRALPEKI